MSIPARTRFLGSVTWLLILALVSAGAGGSQRHPLDPRGEIHIPIGIANTLDSLKTFVEAEGVFSPGVGTYGIYFWVYNGEQKRLFAPTMDDVTCEHGLAEGGHLIPWSQWQAGDVKVRSELAHAMQKSWAGLVHVVASRVTLTNTADRDRKVILYAALRSLGPAGYDVRSLRVDPGGDALLVERRGALVAKQHPDDAGVVGTGTVGEFAMRGAVPTGTTAASESGDCSGTLRFEVALGAGQSRTLEFICPVLPGRRAVRHKWDGVSEWAQFDLAKPNPETGGVLQPDPGLEFYRRLNVEKVFADARSYWQGLVGRVTLGLPDRRWSEAFAAITGHAAMAMNEGAPDVAVVNYNVFNRDGVYVANILQKAGRADLAAQAIDYFITHPFNGRSYPEADNPGQILWIMGEHWQFTRDRAWLERICPAARKIVKMIGYYRMTEGPHWVQMDALRFGDAVPVEKRRELKPGRCDGHNPAYTEAFDLAGMKAATMLAYEARDLDGFGLGPPLFPLWLLLEYERAYGSNLADKYGSYCVLWPCGLFQLNRGRAREQFKDLGPQKPKSWRYFPLARAHQSLLAGNREAGYKTLEYHLDHPQMRRWYAFDEGGKSGSGGWGHLRTTWNGSVAMPHGWAIAELHLLLRDCLVFEDGGKLILLAGVPEDWFTVPGGMEIENLPTHFGVLSLSWDMTEDGATLRLDGDVAPPAGFVLWLPEALGTGVWVGDEPARLTDRGFILPEGTKQVLIEFD